MQYKTLDVPYPKDKDKVKEQVDAEEKEAVGCLHCLQVLHMLL